MSLLVWLPLNGDLRNNGLAETSTISTANLSFAANGKIGKCMSGYTGFFSVPSMVNKKQLSVAYWVRINTATATNWLDAFTWYSTDGTTSQVSRNEFYTNSTYTGFWFAGSPNSISGKKNTVGTWQHHAFVIDYSAGTSEFFINGVSVGKTTGVYTTHYLTGNNFRIGESGLDASYNDFRLYDHVLSDREVKELAKGLVAHWKLDDLIGNENLIRNSNAAEFNGTWVSGTIHHWSRWNQATDNSIELINGKYWFHCKSPASTSYGGFAQDHTLNGDVYRIKPNTQYTVSATWFASAECNCCYWFHWRSSEGGAYNLSQTTKNFTVTTSPQRISATVTSYNHADYTVDRFNLMIGPRATTEGVDVYFTDVKFEEGDTETQWLPSKYDDIYAGWEFNVAHDSSGYCHDGTLSTNPPVFDKDSARYSGSTRFDGVNNYIEIQDLECMPAILEKAWTVSFWVWNNDDGNRSIIFSNFSLGGVSGTSFGIEKATNNNIRIAYVNGTFDKTIASIMDVQMWAHFAVTKTEDHLVTVYKNGVQVGQYTNENCHSSGTIYRIGSDSRSDNTRFNGKLSDIRIYATALSADDVKELYATSASIDDHHNVYVRELVEG